MTKVRLIALSGFLGAGKTTMMTALAQHLGSAGETVAMVTNDQGTELVDSAVVASPTGLSAEVTGGCYCCRFDELAEVLGELVSAGRASTVIAEAVGSCTDLQSTVVRPLRRFYPDQFEVAPLVTLVDPHRYAALLPAAGSEPRTELGYLFDRQLAEADLIVVNKDDTLDAGQRRAIVDDLARRYPRARVLTCSALQGRGLDTVARALDEVPTARWDVEVDYDRYARAEAALAWLNLAVEVRATGEGDFGPATWVITALETLAEGCAAVDAVIGHIKIHLVGDGVAVHANLVGDGQPRLASAAGGRVRTGRALVNARVELATGDLDAIVREAIEEADRIAGTVSGSADGPIAFQPGYPVPMHRMTAEEVS
jgi:Ni2+-binding GTPase involved in maturation of urease and hydrogenase